MSQTQLITHIVNNTWLLKREEERYQQKGDRNNRSKHAWSKRIMVRKQDHASTPINHTVAYR